MINVLIADDTVLLCECLKKILEQDKDIAVCGIAENGLEAYEMCKKLKPDLVLMDMRMPIMGGEESTKKIKAEFPEIKVLVLTTFDDKETVNAALSSGADGYSLKNVDDSKLINAIKCTYEGFCTIGSEIFSNIKDEHYSYSNDHVKLTEREKDVVTLVANGLSNREIAQKLCITEGSVKNYISAIFEKLSIRERNDITIYAVRSSLI